MSRPGGPYDAHADQPPGGWPHHHQLLWLRPDDDGLEDFYEDRDYPNVFDGAGATRMLGGTSAPVDTWTPLAPAPPPEPTEPAASQLTDVTEPGADVAGLG